MPGFVEIDLVGYLRYDTDSELEKLNQIWELDRGFTNNLLTQQKLIFHTTPRGESYEETRC